ncbi:MAG: ATP-binding cassette domain-containing protein [Clostridia bacterium]|nr:ATP-binding cassette domain-containing protein [Clostridia bacterium]
MQQEKSEVKLNNVCLAFGDNVLYDGFCADFSKGINVVLGKSGCGKTSLLNVIMGLVNYKGECIAPKPSVVFSEPTLAPVSVENNVKTVLGRNCDKQVEHALQLACILDKRKQNVTTLSDGEKQRVALARAFAVDRQLMLLDEPFSRLDFGVKKQLYDTLINYLQTANVTCIVVTHDIDEALTLGDYVYYLDGKPCALRQIAKLTCPQNERDIYDEYHNSIRKQLQDAFAER